MLINNNCSMRSEYVRLDKIIPTILYYKLYLLIVTSTLTINKSQIYLIPVKLNYIRQLKMLSY